MLNSLFSAWFALRLAFICWLGKYRNRLTKSTSKITFCVDLADRPGGLVEKEECKKNIQ